MNKLKKIKSKYYDEFFKTAKNSGFENIPQDKVADILEQGVKDITKGQQPNSTIATQINELRANVEGGKLAAKLESDIANGISVETPELRNQIQELKANAADLDAEQVHYRIRRAKAEVPEMGSFGNSDPNKAIAERASSKLRDEFSRRLDNAGLGKAWQDTTNVFEQAVQSKTGMNANILDTEFGIARLTPEQIANSSVSDPEYIKQAIGLARAHSPEAAAQTTEALKSAYLNKIKLVKVEGAEPGKFGFNRDIVKELWGKNADGTVNEALGNHMASKMMQLKNAFDDLKVPIKKINLEDINGLFKSLNEDETKSIIKNIAQKSNDLVKLEDLENNKLIELAKKGQFNIIDHPVFSRAAYSANPSALADVMRKLPAPQKVSTRMDFVEQLFNDFASDKRTATGVPLWDGSEAVRRLKTDKALKSRIRIVMGDEFLSSFEAASKMLDANTVISRERSQLGVKASATPSGIKLFGVGALTYIPQKVMAALYGADSMKPIFRILSQNVGPEATERNLQNYMKNVITARPFITGLAHQARNDPDFREKMRSSIRFQSDDTSKRLEELRLNLPR